MPRKQTPPALRESARIWACRLLHLCQDAAPSRTLPPITLLNRQLVQRPDPAHQFAFGEWPIPGDFEWEHPTFERILTHGTDPDTATFREPLDCHRGSRFNLFERVAIHLETSPDWLFKALSPYFDEELPSVDYAILLIENCLRRFHMQRLGSRAADFARWKHRERTAEVGTHVLSALSDRPDPVHLVLLLALFHESRWHKFDSDQAYDIGDAFKRAARHFVERDEFTSTDIARQASQGISHFFDELYRRVRDEGHRSRSNLRTASSIFPSIIIGPEFEGAEELDFLIEAGAWVPLWIYFVPSLGDLSKQDSRTGLERLFAEAATSPEHWAKYDTQAPSVLRELHRRYGEIRRHRPVRVGSTPVETCCDDESVECNFPFSAPKGELEKLLVARGIVKEWRREI